MKFFFTWQVAAVAGVLLVLGGCSGNGRPIQGSPDTVVGDIRIGGEGTRSGEVDGGGGEFCRVLWRAKTLSSGASTHLAQSRDGQILVASWGQLHALGETGSEDWIWPDDFAGTEEINGQLGTPAVGSEGEIFFTAGGNKVVALNRSGETRWILELDGVLPEAPVVTADRRLAVMTGDGRVHHILDKGQAYPLLRWSLPEEGPDEEFVIVPKIGPVMDDVTAPESRILWVPGLKALKMVDFDHGNVSKTVNLPEGMELTSNLVLDAEGNLYFVAGSEPRGDGIYGVLKLMALSPQGEFLSSEGLALEFSDTSVTGLSMGQKGTWLVGTTAGTVAVVNQTDGGILYNFLDNFKDVPQLVQSADGLIYFCGLPNTIYVLSSDAELLWSRALKDEQGVLEVGLAPSSPLLRDDGNAYFHMGNHVLAVSCTGSGPAGVVWARYGGNNRNTGTLGLSISD